MRKRTMLAATIIFTGITLHAPRLTAQSSNPDYDIKLCNNSPYTSEGCKNTLMHYVKGEQAAANVAADLKSLAKNCNSKKSQTSSCGVLAFAYANGKGVETSAKLAAKYAKKGCPTETKKKSKQRPDLVSCTYQFEAAKKSGDAQTAKKYADRAYIIYSDAGKADIINWLVKDQKGQLGYAVQSGNFRKDCEKGLAIACYADAVIWEKAYGWKNRRGKDLLDVPGMYFQRGCDAGHGKSCFEFARGVKANKVPGMSTSDAGALIARACTNGYKPSCGGAEGKATASTDYRGISPALPVNQQMLMADLAIQKGYAPQAAQTLQRLSAQSHGEAGVRLGSLFLSGSQNFPADRAQALAWYAASKLSLIHI